MSILKSSEPESNAFPVSSSMKRSGSSIFIESSSGSDTSGEISARSSNTICILILFSVVSTMKILPIDLLLSGSSSLPGMLILTPRSSGWSSADKRL